MPALATRAAFAAFCVVTSAGCGTTGWIRYHALDPADFPAHPPTTADVMDCWDHESGDVHTPAANNSPFRARKKIMYVMTCTKDGHAIPGRVLGVWHAAYVALDDWEKYSREVAEKARADGCPAVLVRRTPPPHSTEAQAIGALCVDPTRPSTSTGPLRMVSYTNRPVRILRDDEPYPPDP